MSLAQLLIHVCTIRRIVVVVPDPYGENKETWADAATDVPCRLIEQSQAMIDNARVALTFIGKYRLLVGEETDLRAGDGVIIDGRRDLHHLTALLQEQDE